MARDDYPVTGRGNTSRISQSPGTVMLSAGGVGFLARRGVWPSSNLALTTVEGITALAMQNPMYLISLLADMNVELSGAVWTYLRLACAPDSTRLKAMDKTPATPEDQKTRGGGAKSAGGKNAAGNAVQKVEAADGTEMIEELFESLPDEIGGLNGALVQQMQMVLYYAQSIVEAVPGPAGTGLKELWPIEPISCDFKRESNGKLGLYQRQTESKGGVMVLPYADKYVALPMNRTFWSSLDPTPGNNYGRSPFAPALTEILMNLAFMRDLTLAWHRTAWPRIDVAFDFEMSAKMAAELVDLGQISDAKKYVRDKFQQAQDDAAALAADDMYFHDVNATVGVTGSGDAWPDIPGIYAVFRGRLIMALKMLPTLLGINDSGNSETWSNTQWRIWTAGLMSILRATIEPLRKAAQLHLRLKGKAYTVEVEFEPIRTNQRLVDAQSLGQEITNGMNLYYFGAKTHDEVCTDLTGSPAVAEIQPNPNAPGGAAGGANDGDPANTATNPKPGGKTPSEGGTGTTEDATTKAVRRRVEYYRTISASRRRLEETGELVH